jgi:2-phosphoglycerate kinase
VQCVVAIEDESLHRSHFWVREYATEGLRPLDKYLDSLPQIRRIQEYLVERARRYDVPVIENDSLDRALGDVMDLVLRRADQLVASA